MSESAEDLAKADWVSLKVDAVDEEHWRSVNRPHRSLHLKAIQEGICEFAESFDGVLVTETMMIGGMNDSTVTLEGLARFIGQVKPAVAYLAVPMRPPAEKWVRVPELSTMIRAHQAFAEQVGHVEFLMRYEGNDFAFTGSVEGGPVEHYICASHARGCRVAAPDKTRGGLVRGSQACGSGSASRAAARRPQVLHADAPWEMTGMGCYTRMARSREVVSWIQ